MSLADVGSRSGMPPHDARPDPSSAVPGRGIGQDDGIRIAVGVALLVLIVGWAARRIIRRPERTVWLPETA